VERLWAAGRAAAIHTQVPPVPQEARGLRVRGPHDVAPPP